MSFAEFLDLSLAGYLGLLTLAGTGLALYLAVLEVVKELARRKIFNWKNNE